MEPAVSQIERIAREVIEHAVRAGKNGAGDRDVRRLVEEVLKRIRAEPRHRQGSVPATVVEIKTRVITLDCLNGKLDGAKQITVPRQAVVTPAARDELHRRGIAIGYAIASQPNQPRQTVVWGQAETNYESAQLIDALARERICIEPLAQTGLAHVIDELGDEITKGGKPAVLLTSKPAVALCLANRRRGVRAVMAQTVAATMQVLRAAGGNLLVVDPADRSWFELKRLVGQFVAGAPYPCPAEYRSQLE